MSYFQAGGFAPSPPILGGGLHPHTHFANLT